MPCACDSGKRKTYYSNISLYTVRDNRGFRQGRGCYSA